MELNFEDFRERARNKELSRWEKIGFPDTYRKDLDKFVFEDIAIKTKLEGAVTVLDIGCGCGELVDYIITSSIDNNQQLYLVDSKEMLDNINTELLLDNVHLVPGKFPDKGVLSKLKASSFDVIIVYSVIQYAFINQSIFMFINDCIKLLRPGGRLLIGDIPNFQVRERFLLSEEGRVFQSKADNFTGSIDFQHEHSERIDDSVLVSILLRYRNFGCETYLLPQPKDLPFSNRREDILILKR